jgi:uncharacterized membrane protein YphA (DoxX/SURF4 family)
MKIIRYLSRIIVGIVFIFSGFVKAVDPLGTAYKFQDYFQAFNLEFLRSLALPLAILLITIEFIAGFSVLTGLRLKTGIWGVLLLMLVFTPLTFILALANPVSDCGCFGDAIHLTTWQTFWKNIVLLVFVIFLITGRKNIPDKNHVREWSILSVVIIFFVLFSLYNLKYLPVMDFLPYKKGVNINEGMMIPEGKPSDEYSTTFIYEKDGVQKEFTLENYPADDTTWLFINQKSILLKKGYQPPIHDFSIMSTENEDITQNILTDPEYTVLMITKKLSEADSVNLNKGFELGKSLKNAGISFYVLTSSGSDEVNRLQSDLPFGLMDETTLKSMMRANPGYILIKNGTIIDKWSWANVPDKETFNNL